MTNIWKAAILVACSAAGVAVGYVAYLLLSLALLVVYGDDGQGGHPIGWVMDLLFYGIFAITTLGGFAVGMLVIRKWPRQN